MIASSSSWLGWLAPQDAPVAQINPSAHDHEEIKAILFGVAGVRQRADQIAAQIAAGQAQTTRDITSKLQAIEQNILDKISVPQPPPSAALTRKPGQSPSQPLAR